MVLERNKEISFEIAKKKKVVKEGEEKIWNQLKCLFYKKGYRKRELTTQKAGIH